MDIYAERDALGRQAPRGLSESARRVWDQMRVGRIQNAVALFDAAKRGTCMMRPINAPNVHGRGYEAFLRNL